jgi:hypothetical protein
MPRWRSRGPALDLLSVIVFPTLAGVGRNGAPKGCDPCFPQFAGWVLYGAALGLVVQALSGSAQPTPTGTVREGCTSTYDAVFSQELPETEGNGPSRWIRSCHESRTPVGYIGMRPLSDRRRTAGAHNLQLSR